MMHLSNGANVLCAMCIRMMVKKEHGSQSTHRVDKKEMWC